MSDTWQGPGWRRHEDGKWYPDPEWADPAAPFAPPGSAAEQPSPPTGAPCPPPSTPAPPGGASLPPPPPPTGSYPPAGPPGGGYTNWGAAPSYVQPLSTTLAAWLQGLFLVVAVCSLASLVAGAAAKSAFDTYMAPSGGRGELQSWIDTDRIFGVVNLFGGVASTALLVVMIVWSWKAYRAADALGPGPRKWRIGWTIGAWFIPCAGIILPKLVLDETEKIASSPRMGGKAVSWKGTPSSLIGWAWWVLFVVSNFFVMRGQFFKIDINTGNPTSNDVSGTYTTWIIGFLISAVAAVCGALYVRRVSGRLSAASLLGGGTGGRGGGATGGIGHPGPTPSPLAPTVMGGPSVASVPNAAVDVWATATANAAVFCELCREPLATTDPRCPRCGKRRTPTVAAAPPAPTTTFPVPPPTAPAPAAAPQPPIAPQPPPPAPAGNAPSAPAPPPPPAPVARFAVPAQAPPDLPAPPVGLPPGPPAPPPAEWATPPPLQPPDKNQLSGPGKVIGTVVVSVLLLVLVCLVAVTFLGRSSDDDATTSSGRSGGASSSGFGDVQHKALVDSCMEGGGLGVTRSTCECAVSVMESLYSPEEMADLDETVSETGALPTELVTAIQDRCA